MCVLLFGFGGCASSPAVAGARTAGTLVLVGGGLENDSGLVYRRLAALAKGPGAPRLLIATAASGDQDAEIVDKTESMRVWAADVPVGVLRRETPTADTVAAIDAATAILFTGGDQQRITDRYRPNGVDTPEATAMRRLLRRGGVIAGCSAGCAMMGERMLLGGGSAAALGIAPKPAAGADRNAEPPRLGPRLGPGMAFLPWAFTDSHFYERDRAGRLAAALAATGDRYGLGVGEDAAVEIDVAARAVFALHGTGALVVDASHRRRDGATITGLRARVLTAGCQVCGDESSALPPPMPAGPPRLVPIVEPGQNRQLASWRLFCLASDAAHGVQCLQLDGWQVTAWAAGDGACAFAVGPR